VHTNGVRRDIVGEEHKLCISKVIVWIRPDSSMCRLSGLIQGYGYLD